MKINFRNHNNNEQYACGIKDLKKVFSHDDYIYVNFGYFNRNFCFDSQCIKHPKINGLIICDSHINKRLHITDMIPFLNFYLISDSRYTDDKKEIFKKEVLPTINEWYHKTISEQKALVPGVEVLLVEWTGKDFNIHTYRYK